MSLVTKIEARARVERALVHIENAQRELGEAQAELSSIVGAIPLWRLVGKLYDRVHAGWYKVRDRSDRMKLDLDSLSGQAFEKRKVTP